MTIKQQGGVFGRNPVFNTVEAEGNASVGGNLDVNGILNIGGSEINATEIIVADDAVATITPSRLGGFAFMSANADTFPNVGASTLLYYDAGVSPISRSVLSASWSGSTGNNVNVVTGPLTGTTGNDGNVTFSAVGNGTIQIENRLGGSTQFNLTFL